MTMISPAATLDRAIEKSVTIMRNPDGEIMIGVDALEGFESGFKTGK